MVAVWPNGLVRIVFRPDLTGGDPLNVRLAKEGGEEVIRQKKIGLIVRPLRDTDQPINPEVLQ
jgi:hypothetical protein